MTNVKDTLTYWLETDQVKKLNEAKFVMGYINDSTCQAILLYLNENPNSTFNQILKIGLKNSFSEASGYQTMKFLEKLHFVEINTIKRIQHYSLKNESLIDFITCMSSSMQNDCDTSPIQNNCLTIKSQIGDLTEKYTLDFNVTKKIGSSINSLINNNQKKILAHLIEKGVATDYQINRMIQLIPSTLNRNINLLAKSHLIHRVKGTERINNSINKEHESSLCLFLTGVNKIIFDKYVPKKMRILPRKAHHLKSYK